MAGLKSSNFEFLAHDSSDKDESSSKKDSLYKSTMNKSYKKL